MVQRNIVDIGISSIGDAQQHAMKQTPQELYIPHEGKFVSFGDGMAMSRLVPAFPCVIFIGTQLDADCLQHRFDLMWYSSVVATVPGALCCSENSPCTRMALYIGPPQSLDRSTEMRRCDIKDLIWLGTILRISTSLPPGHSR